jgi:DNA-binding response OmpR family regulator
MARIMIVDDEPSVRKLVGKLLRSQGLEVVEARDGAEALALAGNSPVDLVLLDIDMPGMDGLETLRRLRRQSPQLMVIMVSGIDDEARALRAMDEGARDYVRKPFDLSHLRELVLRHLAFAA